MANLTGFDATQVKPASFEALPAGKYLAVIIDSEMKLTKDGKGSYLQLTFEVTEGEHQGRKLFARLNLDNKNVTAVQIAQAELSAICHAVGVLQPGDSQDLHNLPLCIKVTCKKDKTSGEIQNELKGYEKREAYNATPAPTVQQPGKPAETTPPWLKQQAS